MGPPGVDPDLWARAIVADRSRASWARFTIGEAVHDYRHLVMGVSATALGGSGLLAELAPHLPI